MSQEITQFISHVPHSPFLQAPEWGTFQEKLGFSSELYCERDIKNNIIASMRGVTYPLFFSKNYWYFQQGYCGNDGLSLEKLFSQILNKAKESRVPFIRYDSPYRIQKDALRSWALQKGVQVVKTQDIQPRCTLLLDCRKSEKELLEQMHQKTRYNISLAEKKGIIVHSYISHKETRAKLDSFFQLLSQTSGRHSLRGHSKKYFETLFSSLEDTSCKLSLYSAEKDNKMIAGAVVVLFGDTATYLYGASDYLYRNTMAPYLLQWRCIQDAKRLGFQWYDFWGVAPEGEVRHPLAGVSRFKRGFGGENVCGEGAIDLILDPWLYRVYQIARALRRTIGRGL